MNNYLTLFLNTAIIILTLFSRLERVPTFLVPIITPLLLTTAGSISSLNYALRLYNSELEDEGEIKVYKQALMIGKDILSKPYNSLERICCKKKAHNI